MIRLQLKRIESLVALLLFVSGIRIKVNGRRIEVKIGDYLEPWEIEQVRYTILRRIEEARMDNVRVVQGKRNTDLIVTIDERKMDI